VAADVSSRAVRGIRVALVATTTLAIAAGAHVAGGGTVPAGLGLAALLTLTVATAVAVSRGPLRVGTLLPTMGALEWVLHEGFGILSAAPLPAPGAHIAAVPALAGPAMPMTGTAGTWMLLAHAVGTLATVAVLVAGDRAARRTLVWFTSVLPRVRAVAGRLPDRRPGALVAARTPPRPRPVEGGAVRRRGPPRPGYVLAL
jgi:hypothetical protein